MSLLALVAALAGAPPAPRSPTDAGDRTPVVSYDELRIDVDTAHVAGSGAYGLIVQWTLLDRASSPSSWDAGVRRTVDRVQVDCAGGAIRTLTSSAYDTAGAHLAASSFEVARAPWRVPGAASLGAELTARTCTLLRGRR